MELAMTLAEQIKAMPKEERTAFLRALVEVSEAGRKAGVDPREWAQQYAVTYNEIDRQLKEKA
jgi:hypothetical protein